MKKSAKPGHRIGYVIPLLQGTLFLVTGLVQIRWNKLKAPGREGTSTQGRGIWADHHRTLSSLERHRTRLRELSCDRIQPSQFPPKCGGKVHCLQPLDCRCLSLESSLIRRRATSTGFCSIARTISSMAMAYSQKVTYSKKYSDSAMYDARCSRS